MKYSQKSHSGDRNHNMTVVLFTLLCVLICGSLALSPKAQTKTSDEHVTPRTVPRRNGKIAFTSSVDNDGNGEIYTMEADGSNQTRLTNNPGYDISPKWSPDGTKIAFVSSRDGNNYEIYVMNADGSNQTRLTNNPGYDTSPEWSPDGTKIAFVSRREGNDYEIYVMNADGSNQTRLTNNPGYEPSPEWSPDGTRIVFYRFSTVGTVGIYVMNADGSNQTQLTNSGYDYSPRWSPDSSRITFISTRDEPSPSTCNFNCNVEIYSMNADGSNQTRLTNNPRLDSSPEWSPDGTRIMFRSLRDNYINIYVMNADGTSQTRLTNITDDLYFDVVSPIFSPDGTRIVFLNSYTFIGEVIFSQLYVMNADGSNLVRLTNVYEGGELDWQALPLTSPSCPNPNPIDCGDFFVRQHYRDFLGREPDPAGMAGWLAVLNNCLPGDTSCDRIHVSSAFFRSPEFQERGYFLYRFYSVAFGRKPDFNEFTPDLAKVSGFLTVAELEAAKLAFMAEFMNRPAFLSKFNGLSNTEYVETLLSTADISHPNRDTWIAALTNGSRTRAQVLREIAESTEVDNKYYNQAFVVMQYFGYLRRQPDELYLNWIAHLDGTGDYRSMIHGFMNSIEYRARFGP